MIRVLAPVALVLAAAFPAAATSAPASLEPAFQNTIVSIYPDGRKGELWLNRDGTYRAMGRRKIPSDGRWTVKGDKICLRQSHPPTFPFSYCTVVHEGGVGTSWKSKALTGEPIEIRVVAGRQGE